MREPKVSFNKLLYSFALNHADFFVNVAIQRKVSPIFSAN